MTESDDFETAIAGETERQLLAGDITPVAASVTALEAVKRVAGRIVREQADPLRGAIAIYDLARSGGAWDESDPSPMLRSWGAEFVQLFDELERWQDHPGGRAAYRALIREAARSVLGEREFPDWEPTGQPAPRVRG